MLKKDNLFSFSLLNRFFALSLQRGLKKERIMETMTIAFDDRNMISVLKQLINSMNGVRIIQSDKTVEEKSVDVSKVNKYRISPLIKSMETGIQVSEDISDD